MDLGLEGSVVAVFGAARGIGAAIARAFAGESARVAAVDRDPMVLELAAGLSPTGLGLVADVTDFVTIRGEHLHGDAALIAAGHQGIFDTIYRGSTNSLHVDGVREILPGCLLVHVTSTLDAPTGPLRGISRAQMSAVLVEQDGEWKVTAFHNTLIAS